MSPMLVKKILIQTSFQMAKNIKIIRKLMEWLWTAIFLTLRWVVEYDD